MENAKAAAFQFLKYSIPEFSYNESGSSDQLDINLFPTGIYRSSTGGFEMVIVFIANAIDKADPNEKKNVINVALRASFLFDDKPALENIPEYFYQNALAIVFPYLRAFISNMTIQAQTKIMILPLLNLTGLTNTLKENTKEAK